MQVKEHIQQDIFGAPPVPSYYNTTKESGETLAENTEDAAYQEVLITRIFQKHIMLPPSKCWRLYQDSHGPILLTSCRRAITNLTKRGILVKTKVKTKGFYNRSEYVWKYDPHPIIAPDEKENTDVQMPPAV
jgi:hypothetical protein